MTFKIETPRLTLRPWDDEDAEQLTSGLNDIEIAKWLAFVPHPYTAQDAKSWITNCRENANASIPPVAHEFAVELKSERRVIGGVSLNKIDWNVRTAGGGIWIAKPYQGCGYGREAFAAKVDFAFRQLSLIKLFNGYFEGNEKSWAMQRELGYRHIGETPRYCMADGRQTTEHLTALLRSDWDAANGQRAIDPEC